MKRFQSVPKAKTDVKPSQKMIKTMQLRKRIEVMEEARALGCSVDELYMGGL
ncbi:hypothetical protein vBVhaSMAG7_043 [Vibrio phage vB_VhaS_MAG7]|nr:hypothetical protein vBVhaSMAG7_043 [Vibrio phage vB_VhaS_MAG7]